MADVVTAWQDDPGEPGWPGLTASLPRPTELRDRPFAIAIGGRARQLDPTPGSPGMRYWTAATALARAKAMWLSVIDGSPQWAGASRLAVGLEDGAEVNAYYDRGGLSFHVATVIDRQTMSPVTIATGESPDIVAHELGHAVLDAIRPELWDATFAEVAAFHESFGDISAVLCALALDEIEAEFAALPGSTVFQSSRVSRLGEQMGWALRQTRPDLPDPTCLRDAVSTFFYVPPETLPTTAPSTSLSSEAHNFARVFNSAFMRVLDEMLKVEGRPRTPAKVRKVAKLAATWLVDAVQDAPVVDTYYRAVAMEMIERAATRRRGRYAKAVTTAFVRVGIVTVPEAAAAAGRRTRRRSEPSRRARGAVGANPATEAMSLTRFGLDDHVLLPIDTTPGSRRGAVAAPAEEQATAVASAHYFVEDLFRRNRIELGDDPLTAGVPLQAPRTVTHRFDRDDAGLKIRRVRVDCGFDVS